MRVHYFTCTHTHRERERERERDVATLWSSSPADKSLAVSATNARCLYAAERSTVDTGTSLAILSHCPLPLCRVAALVDHCIRNTDFWAALTGNPLPIGIKATFLPKRLEDKAHVIRVGIGLALAPAQAGTGQAGVTRRSEEGREAAPCSRAGRNAGAGYARRSSSSAADGANATANRTPWHLIIASHCRGFTCQPVAQLARTCLRPACAPLQPRPRPGGPTYERAHEYM